MKRFHTVAEFIAAQDQWHAEVVRLREILQSTRLVEAVRWGAPCYTHHGKNLIGLAAFKSYVGLWFFQGALLSDPLEVLVNAQDGKTKAMRQWRFESRKEIKARAIKQYVNEAIQICEQGNEIKPERKPEVEIPHELQIAFGADGQLEKRFDGLTPGRQREFAEYIASAKRAETRATRIEKIRPMILNGIGLNDKYRNC